MRIRTDDKYQWREDLYDRVGRKMNESTRTGAVDAAAQFSEEMLANLEKAAEHPDMTEELAELLSTSQVTVKYEVTSGVEVDE